MDTWILFMCFLIGSVLSANQVEISTYPESSRVKLGQKITITCKLYQTTKDDLVEWTKTVGSIRYVIIKKDVLEESVDNSRRYVYNRATRNGIEEARLVINDVQAEDIGKYGCRLPSMDKPVEKNIAVCDGSLNGDTCKCIEKNGQLVPKCYEDVEGVRNHYQKITTALVVCIVLITLIGVALSVLVGKDCIAELYKKRKNIEEEERQSTIRQRRTSNSGRGIIYRGLGRASMLGRGNGARSKNTSEADKLPVDEPDRHSNTSSAHIEASPGRYPRGNTNQGYSADEGVSRSNRGPPVNPSYQRDSAPAYEPLRRGEQYSTAQVHAASSDLCKEDPISLVGYADSGPLGLPERFPGTRGIPEGKPSSLGSETTNGLTKNGNNSAFTPVKAKQYDPAPSYTDTTTPNESIYKPSYKDRYEEPPRSRTPNRRVNGDYGSLQGMADYDPSMDIEKPQPQGQMLLTPASLGDPRTPRNRPVPSPRGAYSEAAPPKYYDGQGYRGMEPRQLQYEDKNRWQDSGPYVSTTHSNV